MSVGLASCACLLGALWLGKGRRAQWWLMPAVPLSRVVTPGKGLASKLGQPKLRCGEGRLCWSRLARSSLAAAASGAHQCQILVLGNAPALPGAPCFVCVHISSHTHEGSVWWRGQGEAHLSSPSSREPLRRRADAPALSRHRAELQTPFPCCSSPKVSGFGAHHPPSSGVFGSSHPLPLPFFLCCRLVSHRHCRKAAAFSQSTSIGLAVYFSEQRGCFGGAFPTLSPGLCVHGGKGLVVGAPGRE